MTELVQSDYADKIRKLLDKAESTDSEHERDALQERAFLLMEKYAIDEAMLRDARPAEREELVIREFDFTGRFGQYNRLITSRVAAAFDCKCVVYNYDDSWRSRKFWRIKVHGFASDVEKVALLDASLQIQAARAMKSWEREIGLRTDPWYTSWEKFKMRRDFISGFASGVGTKLSKARQEAVAATARERAEASGETLEQESTGVALVLRDRRERVQDWYDELYGNRLRKSRSYRSVGSYRAQQAGYAAGKQADVGQGGLGGHRRALGH